MQICTFWLQCLTVSVTLLLALTKAEGAPPPQKFELHFYDGQVASAPLKLAQFPVSQLTLEAWLKPA